MAEREREFLSIVSWNSAIHSFWFETVVSVCEKESSTNQSEFRSNQLYKSFRLIVDYYLRRNKIKFRHSFVSAQVFGLPSSTGPLGFPNKVCDSHIYRKNVLSIKDIANMLIDDVITFVNQFF